MNASHDESVPADMAPLADAAVAAARRAYAPYSKFHVGCALRTMEGNVFVGCNVENASYGLTICAERNAIAAAVAEEGAGMRIAALAVWVDASETFPPCGACRQVIAEFAGPDVPVLYHAAGRAPVRTSVGELLPQAFRL
ncbi:cytidine deaminase [Opitutales bacterium ASA1]|uniref:cytidine deaminase n=1 Tax=Congregicoccus parvus TaxID=3081749 RepID=UPI002B2FCA8D|nr:cytidine deaminase [Opitutales bacterium ASA1]